MLFFLMRVDKRLRAQLFCLALIILAVQFPGGEGQDSSTTPAPASTLKCHHCVSAENCDDPAKVTIKDCDRDDKYCMTRIKKDSNSRLCNNIPDEGDCIFKLPDHCLNPKDAGQVDQVKACIGGDGPPFQSGEYDKVCFCEGDLCNSKNLPPVGSTGGSGGSGGSGGGGTDDVGGNDVSTANSTGGSPSNNPAWTFSFALGTVLASVVGILMTTATL